MCTVQEELVWMTLEGGQATNESGAAVTLNQGEDAWTSGGYGNGGDASYYLLLAGAEGVATSNPRCASGRTFSVRWHTTEGPLPICLDNTLARRVACCR